MSYKLIVKNIKTEEVITWDDFDTRAEAEWNIENNIEWEDGGTPKDWRFSVEEVEEDYEWSYNEECGFDPYIGSYSFDC